MRKIAFLLGLLVLTSSAVAAANGAAPAKCPSNLVFKTGDLQAKAQEHGFVGWTRMEIEYYAISQVTACGADLKSVAFIGSGADSFRATQNFGDTVLFSGEGRLIGILLAKGQTFGENQVLPKGYYRFVEVRRLTKENGFPIDVPFFVEVP